MFATSSNYPKHKSPVFGTPKTTNNNDQQFPTGILQIPGFPEYEAAWWEAPQGSGNEGAIFASVSKVSQDRTGKKKTLRTFPLHNGGLFANILGCCTLLDHFSNDPSINEAERRLFGNVSLAVTEALVKHIGPRTLRHGSTKSHANGDASSLQSSMASLFGGLED
ncbi:hypothetical protein [Bythopirellula goksoeyrii]|uniref:Uncharacterized protein n=1 Tax=Bythopirellula goksoeyrii TaxID=1400387 RepID=A0A5B9QNZ9_9BACT|nr:hypothetical protein [Bythopirellula goksoeyrii]QEG35841.1 hypothetical protein Pr1d_31470 [Bythopirellula goksoeyrii]